MLRFTRKRDYPGFPHTLSRLYPLPAVTFPASFLVSSVIDLIALPLHSTFKTAAPLSTGYPCVVAYERQQPKPSSFWTP